MRLAERLLGLTLVGANWEFWLLIALSVVSVAVMVERGIRLAGRQIDIDAFGKELLERLSRGDVSGTRKYLAEQKVPEADVVASGIDQFDRGAAAASAAVASPRRWWPRRWACWWPSRPSSPSTISRARFAASWAGSTWRPRWCWCRSPPPAVRARARPWPPAPTT